MKKYVGTKKLKAIPMNKEEYCQYRQWEVPLNENPKEEGYLVEYLDGGKPNDERHLGYISWSPKDVFEKTYKLIEKNNGVLTEGEKRVRTTFNVLSSKSVDIAKQLMAEAINLLSSDQNDVASYYYDSVNTVQYRELSGDYQREVATAKTKIEEAAMWAVKALTNDIHVVAFNSSTKVEDATIPPHQKRVIEEQVELETKYTNLKIFITNNPIFKSLNEEEQLRLSFQLKVMKEYNNILKDRINNFNNE